MLKKEDKILFEHPVYLKTIKYTEDEWVEIEKEIKEQHQKDGYELYNEHNYYVCGDKAYCEISFIKLIDHDIDKIKIDKLSEENKILRKAVSLLGKLIDNE